MANHKSAKKRIRTNTRKRIVNTTSESKIKTYVEKAEAEKLYKDAVALLDKSTTKGKIHKNTASRKKAALTKHFNSLAEAAPAAEKK
jgi:small subunit ribosomal protein S20